MLPLAIAAVLMTRTAVAFERNACLGVQTLQEKYFFAPSPAACDEYVLCMDGETFVDRCPEGHYFSAPTQNCPLIRDVTCTGCATIGVVNLAHPDSCDLYYECIFGRREERKCPEGHRFDRRIGVCNVRDEVECDEIEWPEWPEFPEQPEGPGGPWGPGQPEGPGGPNQPGFPPLQPMNGRV